MASMLPLMASAVWLARAPLPEPRAGLLQASYGRRLLVAGGTFWRDGSKIWSSRTDFFDPHTNTWSAGPPLPNPRADSAVVTTGDEILIIGGSSDNQALADVLAFTKGRWEQRPAMRLPRPRSYPAAAVVGSRIFVFGGVARPGDFNTITEDVLCQDWNKPGEWRKVSHMPSPLRSLAAVAVIGEHVYLFGGVTPAGDGIRNLAETWMFDAASLKWQRLRDSPDANRAWAAAVRGDSILLLGGYTSDFSRQVLEYSPASDQWSLRDNLTLPRGLVDARFTRIESKLYVTGGESGMRIRSGETWEGTLP